MNRRTFLGSLGGGAVGMAVLNGTGLSDAGALQAAQIGPLNDQQRRATAFRVRTDAARLAMNRPLAAHPDNGEEALYGSKIASYSKGLPHNGLGEVDLTAYAQLLAALQSGSPSDFEGIPLGLGRQLTNPLAGLGFDLEGADSHHLGLPPAPTIAGSEGAAELAELYWMALARDVPFSSYAFDATIAAAGADLSTYTAFKGPKDGGAVTAGTIFRGNTPGDLEGPYLSQFLWRDIPMGAVTVSQRMRTTILDVDYMTNYSDWLDAQNGAPAAPYAFDPTPRYIRSLRDLAEWVHVDALYQAYHQACLILLGLAAPVDPGNPYATSLTQIGFGTFGGPHILSLVTEVATRALKAVWYQKWFVHRRLRPEAFGGLVHNTRTAAKAYPVSAAILNSAAVDSVYSVYGTYLLPMAFPDGCPTHPSYGAGHATVAGACVTTLKAWFDESWPLPDAVVTDAAGTSLVPYAGATLTVGNELNKLAANVAIGRNAGGLHYRSDYWESLKLGEAIAISILQEQKLCHAEDASFTLTMFDGATVTI